MYYTNQYNIRKMLMMKVEERRIGELYYVPLPFISATSGKSHGSETKGGSTIRKTVMIRVKAEDWSAQ